LTFGRFDVAAVMLCYGIALAILTWIGTQKHYGWFYFSGLGVATGIALYHWTLIRGRERAKCFKAFLHNNWIGAAIFAGLVAELNLRPLL
jgi:4-hydroxybenzoate polyprenyltransferase